MKRLASIDVLRGLDMFWIVGGAPVLCAIATLITGHADNAFAQQMEHVEWEGLHFIDLIFPLFVFIAGITYPFSHAKRVAAGERPLATHLAILRRSLTLLALGLVYNGFLASDFSKAAEFRYFSVLGKIGIAWGVAALIYVHFNLKARFAFTVGGLAAYGVMCFCVAPDAPAGAGCFTLPGCFVGWLDRLFTPGYLYCDNLMEPSGPFVSFFGYPTALLGMCAGDIVRSAVGTPTRRSLQLAACGVGCLALGYALSPWLPIIKKLWTPTFALVASGYGFLAFAAIHQVVDVWGWTRWSRPFMLIGVNAIAIYLASRFVNFNGIGDFFVSGLAGSVGAFAPLVHTLGAFGARMALLAFLHRHKIFFKV